MRWTMNVSRVSRFIKENYVFYIGIVVVAVYTMGIMYVANASVTYNLFDTAKPFQTSYDLDKQFSILLAARAAYQYDWSRFRWKKLKTGWNGWAT